MSEVNPKIIHSDDIGQRIRAERERVGLSQTELGALGGVQKNAQHNYESGKRTPDALYLACIARAGIDVAFIVTGERSAASLPSSMILAMQGSLTDPREFAPVPLYQVELAAGTGVENHQEDLIDHLAFRRSWLKRIGVSSTNAVIARAKGDSMAPTIQGGDVVLIDLQATGPSQLRSPEDQRPAPIYALRDDGGARIKRLVLAAPGTMALLSDNPAYPPEIRKTAEIAIIGRVKWWGHTNKE